PQTTTTTSTTTPVTTTVVTPFVAPTLSLPYANATTPAEIAANRTVLISYIVNLIQALQARQTTTTISGIPAGFQFTTTLVQGSTGNDVKYLQIFLNSDSATSIGNAGDETTYFGAMTKTAVGKFQIKYGLVSSASDAGYGSVGPKTRAKINTMLGK
ncbi:MAG: peptidoglycan-binding domain-containing protein, partial [Candidatus Pacebacteria bacterium]|nr:peptidoglycan-binding domain-containing protein [Candidatus Paceibacterota bacterium]